MFALDRPTRPDEIDALALKGDWDAIGRDWQRVIMRNYRTQVPENTLRSIQRRFDRVCHR